MVRPTLLAISRWLGKQNGRRDASSARPGFNFGFFALALLSLSFHPLIKCNKVHTDWNFRAIWKTRSFFVLMRHFHFEVDLCSLNWKMKVNWVFFKKWISSHKLFFSGGNWSDWVSP